MNSVASISGPDRQTAARRTQLVDLLRSLRRAVATVRSHPAGNALVERALADFAVRSRSALPARLLLDGGAVKDGTDGSSIEIDPGLATLMTELYRDGVRELRLAAGMERPEIDRFVSALAMGRHDAQNLADDYVTRLWEAELPNVAVLALDPYLDRDIPGDVLEGKARPTGEMEGIASDLSLSAPPPPDEAFQLTNIDRENLDKEAGLASGGPPWAAFGATLVEAAGSAVAARRSRELATLIETTLYRLLQEGQVAIAGDLVRSALTQVQIPGDLLQSVIQRAGRAERLAPLGEIVERDLTAHAAVRTLLRLLAANALGAARDFLLCARSAHARRFWAEALTESGDPGLDTLVEIACSADGESRAAAARVLAATGQVRFAPTLWRAFERSEGAARREVLRAATALAPDTARLIAAAVGDGDSECRLTALGSLSRGRDAVAEARLLARLASREADELNDAEKDALYRALSSVGDARALEYLAKQLSGGWLGGGDRALQTRAARALARLKSPRARELLRTKAAGGGALARLCQRALLECGEVES